ncbi:1717_t:CDS:2 [Entrophospora sp. SA101]|nr:1717_t:CDS:2 [Entrophospora sp. SA101]
MQSGLDGNNESLNILCPHDLEHQGAYDDIISYLSKRPTLCITKEFYLQVNSSNSG